MSISERYRDLVQETEVLMKKISTDQQLQGADRAIRVIDQGLATLQEQLERVGEIPRMRFDTELSPVLLNAHNLFDRGRLLLEEGGCNLAAEKVWDVQKKLYRLLNDL
ncbi:MAG: hypothetical protein J7K75_01740 [Desulfuromonas sp.]|nr:hypothetical protein [Desulfuromonas sp.]